MIIDIICSDETHPIHPFLDRWKQDNIATHQTNIFRKSTEVTGGDILFLISCSEIVSKQIRGQYRQCFVVHASDLPKGRGWSPLVWQILEGQENIYVSLIEADDPVDSGKVWRKECVYFAKHFDFEEICRELFVSEIRLMDYAVEAVAAGKSGTEQVGEETYYAKRNRSDSRIDIEKPLREQFNLLRVSDPTRYPIFFDHLGYRYQLVMKKIGAIDEK
jgi:methionyl-tRNA formyltransferase